MQLNLIRDLTSVVEITDVKSLFFFPHFTNSSSLTLITLFSPRVHSLLSSCVLRHLAPSPPPFSCLLGFNLASEDRVHCLRHCCVLKSPLHRCSEARVPWSELTATASPYCRSIQSSLLCSIQPPEFVLAVPEATAASTVSVPRRHKIAVLAEFQRQDKSF